DVPHPYRGDRADALCQQPRQRGHQVRDRGRDPEHQQVDPHGTWPPGASSDSCSPLSSATASLTGAWLSAPGSSPSSATASLTGAWLSAPGSSPSSSSITSGTCTGSSSGTR